MKREFIGIGALGLVFFFLPSAEARGQSSATQAASLSAYTQSAPITPVLAGTIAVPISAKRFWDNWERARRDASAMPQMRRLIAPALKMSRYGQIAYIQAAVTRAIKWQSDTTQYGRHDYWASAPETLRTGYGDMEDRAIVKMQALRALGTPTRDLYLTLARDTVGGPETVLVVRDGPHYYILDDTGGAPYQPQQRKEFQPVLTFGYGASWVHRPIGAQTAAVVEKTAATTRSGGN